MVNEWLFTGDNPLVIHIDFFYKVAFATAAICVNRYCFPNSKPRVGQDVFSRRKGKPCV